MEKMGPKELRPPGEYSVCPVCEAPFKEGDYTTLIPIGVANEKQKVKRDRGEVFNAVCVEVHWECRPQK